jgi:large subunit ribosomal protein L25
MKQSFTLNATLRGDLGKGASRRLRHDDKVPGIVYGAGKEPSSIVVEHNPLLRLLQHESFYTRILDLVIDGHKEQVVLRDLQRHPFKPRILHLDLQRISATEKIAMNIPLHFIGGDVAPGVKVAGGIVSHLMSDVEVRCLPKFLPEFIDVDLSKVELNQTVHLSDLKLDKEVEIVALAHGENKGVATIYIPRAVVEDTAAPVSAEVPVIGKQEAKEGEEAEGEAKAKGEAESKGKDKEKAPADKKGK